MMSYLQRRKTYRKRVIILILSLTLLIGCVPSEPQTAVLPTITPVPPTATAVIPTRTPIPAALPADTPAPVPPHLQVYESADNITDFVWFADRVWTATENGVLAWNMDTGNSVSYTAEHGLPDNFVTHLAICPLPDPALLAATKGGWTIFNPALDRWDDIQPLRDRMEKLDSLTFGRGLPDTRILLCDAAMDWLLFGSEVLYRLDMGKGTAVDVFGAAEGLPLASIDNAIIVGDKIWMVSQRGGTAVLRDNEIVPIKSADFVLDTAMQVASSPDGVIWIGTPAGLVRWHEGETELWLGKTAASAGPFIPYVSHDGKLWVDFGQNQVCQLNIETKECDLLLTPEDGLPDAVITGFTEDDTGNLYIRTAGNYFARWVAQNR